MRQAQPPVTTLLWGSFLASQVVYVLLGLSGLLRGAGGEGVEGDGGAGSPPGTLVPIALGGIAVVLGVVAHIVFRRAPARPPGPIVAWALDEAIALLGLGLCFLGYPTATWLPFSGIGLGLTLLHRGIA